MAKFDFSGRTALVTGAASGIGAAISDLLARSGAARLILVDQDAGAIDKIDVPCAAERFIGDVADESLWARIEQACSDRLDHAVLNAGVSSASPIAELALEEWRRVLAVNLDGAMLGLRCAMRIMQGQKRGSVVLTASASGLKAEPGVAAYGVSKAGVIQLAKVAAKEGAPHGVRVNAIAPGGVDTPIWDQIPMFADFVAQQGSREAAIAAMGQIATPLGRYARAEEIATQIAFLLSDDAATMTGSVLVSDGGYIL